MATKIKGTVLDYAPQDTDTRVGHLVGYDGLKYHFQAIDIDGDDPETGDEVTFTADSGRRATSVTVRTRLAERVLPGTVKRFNPERESGFITAEDTVDYYVHHDDVVNGELSAGDRVEFSPAWTDRGPRAEYVVKHGAPENREPPVGDDEPIGENPAAEPTERTDQRSESEPIDPVPNFDQQVQLLDWLAQLVGESWQLFWNGAVRFRHKLIPLLGMGYVISPLDFLPELGLGVLGLADDAAILVLTLSIFRRLAAEWLARAEQESTDDCEGVDGCEEVEEVIEGVYTVQ